MPLTELSTAQGSPYLDIQSKLDEPLHVNDLCKEWVIEWLTKNAFYPQALTVLSCGQKAVHLACSNGHQKMVRITCHKEYCPTCGSKGSMLHKERYLRAMDRLIWSPVLGYMIFTLPKEVSAAMPSKQIISGLEKAAVKLVQDNFSAPGCMARVHFMGQENEKLHIHINVLFPLTGTNGKGQVPKEILFAVRQSWTKRINQIFGLKNKYTNVFYSFATSPVKMRHKIKYVCRPIVTAEKFLSLSNEAKHWYLSFAGWHNTRWYGKLANCKYKEYLKTQGFDYEKNTEADLITSKKCPVCNEPYKYQGIVDVNEIAKNQFRQVEKNVWVCLETFFAIANKASPCPDKNEKSFPHVDNKI